MKISDLAEVFTFATLAVVSIVAMDCSFTDVTSHDGYSANHGGNMPDGTVYAGISPDTKKPMYTTPGDAPGVFSWSGAKTYCSTLDVDGHKDWRVPAAEELGELFRNRAAIGGFNETGRYPRGWYWASSAFTIIDGNNRNFSDGGQSINLKPSGLSVRCVR